MKFFDNQKIDDAGRTGVRLQKIILFFATITTVGGFFGLPLSLITVAISLAILALGFFGAYNRHSCMLKGYAVIRILELVFHFLMLVIAFVILFLVVGVLIAGTAYQNYYNEPMPLYIPLTYSIPMEGVTTSSGPMFPVQYVNDYVPLVYYYSNYYGGINVDMYYEYVNQFSTGQIVGLTILFTAVVFISVIISFIYYAVIAYTIVLSFRMVKQIKQSATVYAAVSQKELETSPQPFVYVVADPTNGNQPVYLQPVDPSVFQMQNLA